MSGIRWPVAAGFDISQGFGRPALRIEPTMYLITDTVSGAAMAFGPDQSGIGSTDNRLTAGVVARTASGIAFTFGGGASGNTLDGGTGSGRVTGNWQANTVINWSGLTFG